MHEGRLRFGRILLLAGYVSLAVCWSAAGLDASVQRGIPEPLPSRPGNIFLAGENVVIAAPPGEVQRWRMHSYEDKIIAKGEIRDGKIDLGKLPVGYYKIVRGPAGQLTNRTWIGVLEPLKASTPTSSPVCIDVAMAWFFREKEKMREVANLCQLAGINRVRDRLLWAEMEPKRGQFAPHTRYDLSAEIQAAAGLDVLQVCHVSAGWATTNTLRFPPDLRDTYSFYREAARRWKGRVDAFEPWNEADIHNFGGHTGSEMASFQKACFLGLKAGNPDVTACLNVFAIRRPETLRDFRDNEAEAYFDTYNLHHYEPLTNYASLYADHRAISGGKPLWVSECSVRVKWRGDERFQELSEADLRLQSERLTKTYAMAIHEGGVAVFYFMLPHYVERQLQYGILRRDLTPRPAYVALAAVGRLLADAKPLGRLKSDVTEGYAFQARPDGEEKVVVAVWSDQERKVSFEEPPQAVFNHLGQEQSPAGGGLSVGSAPIYAMFDAKAPLEVTPPPMAPKLATGLVAGSLVLQALVPENKVVLEKSAYSLAADAPNTVPVFLYNFGSKLLEGKFEVLAPKGWRAEFPKTAQIPPGGRIELPLILSCPDSETFSMSTVKITGAFGGEERPVLSLQFVPQTASAQTGP